MLKIHNTFLDLGFIDDRLKEMVMEYIKENNHQFPYEIIAELSVIYSTRMVKAYKDIFFSQFYERFMRDLPYLSDEIFYKILWSMVKADHLKIHEISNDWITIKDII